ncbi:bifunctional enoyl-CoA hydratase/phosphate acetyltransferase [Guggenheimella bovis]
MIKTFEELRTAAKELKGKKIAVCMAENEEVLEAVENARKLGIADAVLVGEGKAIKELLQKLSIDENNYEFVEASSKEEGAMLAVKLVGEGKCDVLMKGLVDTSIILKAVLNKEWGLRESKVMSHVALFKVPRYHKMFVITDAAMNITPDVDQKEAILRNALQVTKALGIETAKVAALAAKEKVSDKMQATIDAKELSERNIPGAIVDGPLALDNAISKESAIIKGIDSPVAGDVDILLMPQIESGNVLYKALSYLSESEAAGILLGAKAPVVLTSRADEEEVKLNSIALALLVSESRKDQ